MCDHWAILFWLDNCLSSSKSASVDFFFFLSNNNPSCSANMNFFFFFNEIPIGKQEGLSGKSSVNWMLQILEIPVSVEATAKWGRKRKVRVENRGRKSRYFSLMRKIWVFLDNPAVLPSTGVFHLRSSLNCEHVPKCLGQGQSQCVAHAVHAFFLNPV